jgi:GntR family transcriptional regulator / MocR family aminotransferase
MTSSRATSGVEVQVDLAGRRVRSGLEDELRDAVRTGRLAPGARLPSSRTLARDLGISRNTVADAFGQLVAEGWFVSRHGAGTWVADQSDLRPDPADPTGTAGESAGLGRTPGKGRTAGDAWPGAPARSRRTAVPVSGGGAGPGGTAGTAAFSRTPGMAAVGGVAGVAGADSTAGVTGMAGAGGMAATTGVAGTTGVADEAGAAGPEEQARRVRFDLRPGQPDLSAFPRTDWLAASRRALAEAPDDVLGYSDAQGLAGLREALAGYLARARRVTGTPDRIVVCAGFTQALELLAGVLRARGARAIAVEAYGHRLHRDILHHAGLATVALPVDGRGAMVDTLDRLTGPDGADAGKVRRGKATGPADVAAAEQHQGTGLQGDVRGTGGVGGVLLTPAHQFPLGVALDPTRRRQVVAWAADTGALVVEDDYDGEFRYDRQTVGAVHALAPDHVVYAGTAAKSLAPGLRLAWLVLPAGLVDEMVETMRRRGLFPSVIEQLTLAELLVSGGFDRHVRRARLAYRRRRDRLVAVLAREVPAVGVSGIAAGLHALVHLPDPTSEPEVIARAAADHGLALEGLTAYTEPGHERGPALVVGYATAPGHAYTATLARLTATLAP